MKGGPIFSNVGNCVAITDGCTVSLKVLTMISPKQGKDKTYSAMANKLNHIAVSLTQLVGCLFYGGDVSVVGECCAGAPPGAFMYSFNVEKSFDEKQFDFVQALHIVIINHG